MPGSPPLPHPMLLLPGLYTRQGSGVPGMAPSFGFHCRALYSCSDWTGPPMRSPLEREQDHSPRAAGETDRKQGLDDLQARGYWRFPWSHLRVGWFPGLHRLKQAGSLGTKPQLGYPRETSGGCSGPRALTLWLSTRDNHECGFSRPPGFQSR